MAASHALLILFITLQVGGPRLLSATVAQPYKMSSKDSIAEMEVEEKNLPRHDYENYSCEPWVQMVDCFILLKDEWLEGKPMSQDELLDNNLFFFTICHGLRFWGAALFKHSFVKKVQTIAQAEAGAFGWGIQEGAFPMEWEKCVEECQWY